MDQHNGKIVDGSLKLSGMSVSFVVRCCDDPATDYNVTIKDIHRYTEKDLNVMKEQILRVRSQAHADAMKLAEIFNGQA